MGAVYKETATKRLPGCVKIIAGKGHRAGGAPSGMAGVAFLRLQSISFRPGYRTGCTTTTGRSGFFALDSSFEKA